MTESNAGPAPNPTHEVVVSCGTSMEIGEIADLKKCLLEAVDCRNPVVLDGSEIAKATTGGLQVLTAFAREARDRDIPFRWLDPTEEVVAAARLLDLDRVLELPARGGEGEK